jgi:hypothetical protein
MMDLAGGNFANCSSRNVNLRHLTYNLLDREQYFQRRDICFSAYLPW